jgi:competence protein ComEC
MVLGGAAVFISLFVFPLGQLIAWAAWPLTAYTIRVVELFDRVPHAVVYLGSLSLTVVVAFYVVLFAVTFAGSRMKGAYDAVRQRFRYLSLTTLLIALFVCLVFVWRLVAVAPDGRLHVTFFSVGSADAVLIRTPGGRNILINGGPSASQTSDALGRRLSPLDHTLDWLVLASTGEDQVGALPQLLPRFPPRHVLLGAPAQASFSAGDVMQWLADEGVPVTQAEEGQTLDLGDGGTLKVVNLSSQGATLLLEWDTFRALLPIGANLDTLDQLKAGADIGPVDVLLLAQSGYAALSPPEWIHNLNPRLVVISVAAGDRNGMPDKETIDALDGYSVLRTDWNGWVEVVTDGKQMWVSDQRQVIAATPTP